MTIEERLREKRNAAGLTQEELAIRLNVTRQTISNWETGKRLPDIGAFNQLAKIYGITLDELCGDVTRRPVTYPKSTDILTVISIVLCVAYFVIGIATSVFDGGIAILMIITSVFMQAFVHLFFKSSVINESFTGIAGYDSSVGYNVPELKAMLTKLDIHLSCLSTGSMMMYFICSYLPEKASFMTEIILTIYCLDYIGACLFMNYGSNDIFLNERDKKVAKAGRISVIWYVVIILAACGTAVEQVMTHKMAKNSIDSLVWCGWLFLLLLIASVGLFVEQKRAKELAESYRPGKCAIIIAILCIIILILML